MERKHRWIRNSLLAVLVATAIAPGTAAEAKTLGGKLSVSQGAPIPNFEVEFWGQTGHATYYATSGTDGRFEVTVPDGWQGDVRVIDPLIEANWTPFQYEVTGTFSNTSLDFTGNMYQVRIEGIAKDDVGNPITSLSYDWSSTSGQSGFVLGEFDGTYRIRVPVGQTITVVPERGFYKFCPASKTYSNLTAPRTELNFDAEAPFATRTITGTIQDESGNPINANSIQFDPYESGATFQTGAGTYTANVLAGWTGTIVPVAPGYTFTPSSHTEVCDAISNNNFTGIAPNQPPGSVTWLTDPRSTSTSGQITMTVSTATDPDGDPVQYQFEGRDPGGSWAVLATQPSRTFVETGLSENKKREYRARATDLEDLGPSILGTGYSRVNSVSWQWMNPTQTSLDLDARAFANYDEAQSGYRVLNESTSEVLVDWVQDPTPTMTGLTPDTYYAFRGQARNGEGHFETGTYFEGATHPYIPDAPEIVDVGANEVTLRISPTGNPDQSEISIFCVTLGQYVTTSGSLQATRFHAPISSWSDVTLDGLTTGTEYCFASSIYTVLNLETAFGVSACATPRDWSAVSGGGLEDSGFGRGCAWGDFDGDDDDDLYLVRNGANILYENDGGTFVEVTGASVLADAGNGSSATWGDYDDDGRLDLYVANRTGVNRLFRNTNGTPGGFEDIDNTTVRLPATSSSTSASWVDYDDDGDLDLYVTNIGEGGNPKDPNALLRNDGGNVFVNVTATSPHFAALKQVGTNSHDATWADYNQDGKVDVYVVNSELWDNVLFKQTSLGSFTPSTAPVADNSGEGRGANWIDYDNDGILDLFVTNTYGDPNRLFRGLGSPSWSFAEVVDPLLNNTGESHGSTWLDYDNDGDLDLYMVNWSNTGFSNRLIRNEGTGFVDDTDTPIDDLNADGVGASSSDFDGDGRVDLFVANFGEPDALFRNRVDNGNHWFQVRLEGVESNESGLGARVRLWTSPTDHQTRVITGATGCNAQDAPVAHFGLGTSSSIHKLQIWWPMGEVQDIYPPSVDVSVKYTEPNSGGGHCPYLYTFDGNEYRVENTLLAEVAEEKAGVVGSNFEDRYLIETPAAEVASGVLGFEVREFEEEHSFFDKIRLDQVEYPIGTELALLESGRLVAVSERIEPTRVEQEGRDLFEILGADNGHLIHGRRGDKVVVEFPVPRAESDHVLFGIRHGIKQDNGGGSGPGMGRDGASNSLDRGIAIRLLDGEQELDVAHVAARELESMQYVELSPEVIDQAAASGRLQFEMEFFAHHTLAFTGLFLGESETVEVLPLGLELAEHSAVGSQMEVLGETDGEFAELKPGETLALQFAATAEPSLGRHRSHLLTAVGHYYRTAVPAEVNALSGPVSRVQLASQNPVQGSAQVRFGLPEDASASITVYAADGRRVRELTDGDFTAGWHTVDWDGLAEDGRSAPAGVYFYRLDTSVGEDVQRIVRLR